MEENQPNVNQSQENVNQSNVNQSNANQSNGNKSKSENAIREGFVGLFKNPFALIEKASNGPKNYFLIFAVILFVVWTVAGLLKSIISTIIKFFAHSSYLRISSSIVSDIFSIIGTLFAPAVIVALISLLIYLFKKGEKKSFMTIVISVVIAYAPTVLASVVGLLGIFTNTFMTNLVVAFSGFCSLLTAVLLFFTIKSLYNEQDNNVVMRKYLIIMGIYYAAYFVFNLISSFTTKAIFRIF